MEQLTFRDVEGLLLGVYLIVIALVGILFQPGKVIMGSLLGVAIILTSILLWRSFQRLTNR